MIVTEKISKNKRIVHHIFEEEPNQKSYASYVLLKEYYKQYDIDFSEDKDWRYYFIIRRHFLRKMKKQNGGFWICHYCGKKITTIQKRNSKDFDEKSITVDHKFAISKGGDELDTNNMVECCYECNIEKGVDTYDSFKLKKEKIKLEKINNLLDNKIKPLYNFYKMVTEKEEKEAVFNAGIILAKEFLNILNLDITEKNIKECFPDLSEETIKTIMKTI
jgi:5-methylcytosine-specific restriction endonuclease McrA